MGFKVGEKIGGYRFLRVVDAGGSAMVYEVENEVAGRREILKLLPRGFEQDRRRVERFLREAKIHSHLSHPCIAEFYSGLQLDGQLVMTMEAVDGTTLQQRLAEGPLSMLEAVDIARTALDALGYAHEQRIVHREITPANLILLPGGGLKIANFGLAKQSADPALTQPGTVLGSVHYMSPEQVKGILEIDGRSDIYSMGVILYEALTGSKPFDSRSQFDIIQAHVMQPPPPPTDLRADLPLALADVVLKALEKFPDERYQTAGEFRAKLDEVRARLDELRARPSTIKLRPPMADLEEELDRGAHRTASREDFAASSRAGLAVESLARIDPQVTAMAEALAEDSARASIPLHKVKPVARPSSNEAAGKVETKSEWNTRDLLLIGSLTAVMALAAVIALMVMLHL